MQVHELTEEGKSFVTKSLSIEALVGNVTVEIAKVASAKGAKELIEQCKNVRDALKSAAISSQKLSADLSNLSKQYLKLTDILLYLSSKEHKKDKILSN